MTEPKITSAKDLAPIINRIAKQDFDELVANGTITEEMLAEQIWAGYGRLYTQDDFEGEQYETLFAPMRHTHEDLIPKTDMGVANGVATLGDSGTVPPSQLPSYVDDVIEYGLKSQLPNEGEQGKIYVIYEDTKENNGQYRWTGSTYVSISSAIDFATGAEAVAGVDNTKAMTPLRTFQAIDSWTQKEGLKGVVAQLNGHSFWSGTKEQYDADYANGLISDTTTCFVEGGTSGGGSTEGHIHNNMDILSKVTNDVIIGTSSVPVQQVDSPFVLTGKYTEDMNILMTVIDKLKQRPNPNLLINGDFQVWQRGVSFTNPSINTYSADRWRMMFDTGMNISCTKVTNGAKYIVNSITSPSTAYMYIIQNFIAAEELNSINGKSVTISAKIKSNRSVAIFTKSGIPTIYNDLSTGKVIKLTDTADVLSEKFTFGFGFPSGTGLVANDFIEVEWVKLELGSDATPFISKPYAEELALCQRYFNRLNTHASAWLFYGMGVGESATIARIFVPLPVPLRTFECTLPVTGYGGHLVLYDGSTVFPVTAITKDQSSSNGVSLQCTVASGLTAKQLYVLRANDALTHIDIDAEIY